MVCASLYRFTLMDMGKGLRFVPSSVLWCQRGTPALAGQQKHSNYRAPKSLTQKCLIASSLLVLYGEPPHSWNLMDIITYIRLYKYMYIYIHMRVYIYIHTRMYIIHGHVLDYQWKPYLERDRYGHVYITYIYIIIYGYVPTLHKIIQGQVSKDKPNWGSEGPNR